MKDLSRCESICLICGTHLPVTIRDGQRNSGGDKMKFYYENCMGDSGHFQENDLIKAIYSAWNIDAHLYLIDNEWKLVFAPWESNEINSELLEEYGYYMVDGEKYREIRSIDTNQVVHYDWSEVISLTV